MSDARFPIGRFQVVSDPTPEQRQAWIEQVREHPAELRRALDGMTEEQLDTPYREGGWTVRQVAHHLPDSHLNAYVRFRLALTEDEPTIRPYDEASWANLPDASSAPVDISVTLLDALHRRLVLLLESMGPEDFARPLMHPENGRMTLDRMLQLYAWHGRHHVAHIDALRQRMGWS